MKIKAFAERIGISPRRVGQILEAQKVSPESRGEYGTEAALAIARFYREAAERNSGDYAAERTLLTRVRRETAQEQLAILRKEYFARAEVTATIGQLARSTRGLLQRKLEAELPPKLAGLDVPAITEAMRRTVDEVCTAIQNGTEEYTKEPHHEETTQTK